MILAVPLRTTVCDHMKPWDMQYYICDHYKNVFDPLKITLWPVLSDTTISAEEIEKHCDGLVIAGSDKNILPMHYGRQIPEGKEDSYVIDEYSSDRRLLEAFEKAGKPVLGLCGGLQVINVYFGGTLKEYIPGHNQIAKGHILNIEKGTFMHEAYGSDILSTNSYHCQCADDVAPGFIVSARAQDGNVEAIERGNIIGVQWHPEVSVEMPIFNKWIEKFF